MGWSKFTLPGIDGMEVLRRLRMDAGFDGYLAKPLTDFAEILATVERCLVAR